MTLFKNCDLSLKDIDTKKGIVMGYASAFNNIDHDGDMIAQGAFRKTISENGPEGKNLITHLYQHDYTKILGKPMTIREDEKGLYFESKIVPTQLGRR